VGYWALIGVLVIVPLVAIWRNIATLALIFAELAGQRTRLPGPLVENAFKVVSAVAVALWLWRVLPLDAMSRWAWVVIGCVLAGIIAVFSRRLIYWHSQWQSSLNEVFAGGPADASRVKAQWMQSSLDWGIRVQELVLPEYCTCSGATIAQLGVRSRFGCTIVEIDRQGHILIAPDPSQALYAGDRLLLLGTPSQIAAARAGLGESRIPDRAASFNHARLETLIVPPGPRTGQTLAELKVTRHLGVLVVGVNRAGVRIVNPGGGERIDEGDELLVLGAPEPVRLFKRWLAAE
jgi:monovalent cation:H+ antiporter-2, CPA2 family